MSIQTNGISLGKFMKRPDNPEDLASIKLLTLSLYADSPELHADIAGVNSFEKVVSNIQKAISLKNKHGLDVTVTGKILVDTHNYKRLPEIVRFYRELGLDAVGLREVQDYNYGGAGQRPVSVELTKEQKAELAEIVSASSFQDKSLTNFARTVERSLVKPMITKHCFNATDGHFACIDARGEVFTGNPEIGDEKFSIGNVLEKPWGEIWNSERHQEVIKLMDDMQIAGVCASALCRHVRANVGVQEYLEGKRGKQDRALVMGEGNFGAFL